jgi:hypothetical protein
MEKNCYRNLSEDVLDPFQIKPNQYYCESGANIYIFAFEMFSERRKGFHMNFPDTFSIKSCRRQQKQHPKNPKNVFLIKNFFAGFKLCKRIN